MCYNDRINNVYKMHGIHYNVRDEFSGMRKISKVFFIIFINL